MTDPDPVDPALRAGIDLIPTLGIDDGLLARARAMGNEFQVSAESCAP